MQFFLEVKIYKSLYFAKNDAKSFHHLSVLEAYAIEYNKCGGHLDDPNIIDYFYKNDRIDILIYLYFCLSDSLQRDLQLKLKNYRFKNTAKSYYEYYVLVNNKIIDFDTSITDSMFSLLNDLLKKNENSNSISYPSPGFNLMETLIFLYQGHFIDDKNKMMAYAKKFETKKFQWEIDPISFNYDNFDISWLENENDDFLYELSQNEDIKSKIIDKFKKAYNRTYKNKLIKNFSSTLFNEKATKRIIYASLWFLYYFINDLTFLGSFTSTSLKFTLLLLISIVLALQLLS